MISKIKLCNFKSHKDTSLPMSGLTIFTGMNGMGKSSVVQALLMLREGVESERYQKRLSLSGDSFQVGGSSAVVMNWEAGQENDDLLHIEIIDENTLSVQFNYRYPKINSQYLEPYPGRPISKLEDLEGISLFGDNFQYLSANRYGPVDTSPSDSEALARKQISVKLGRGEYVAAILGTYGDAQIAIPEMSIITEGGVPSDASLRAQTAQWLKRISPNISLSVDQVGDKFQIRYTYPGKGVRHSVIPSNTGYGVSYILSVITALLITRRGGLVIVENPEAHIHPSAQSALMQLVSLAVSNGVQVIMETHSDHIIFGALVNHKQKALPDSSLSIIHFDFDSELGIHKVEQIEIGPDSRLKNTPRHFVEQMNLDLDILFDE